MNNCECYRNCADTKYHLYSKRRVKVIQEPSLRIEMIHSKTRLKREVLYGFIECLSIFFFKTQKYFIFNFLVSIYFSVSIALAGGLLCGLSILSSCECVYFYFFHFIRKTIIFKNAKAHH